MINRSLPFAIVITIDSMPGLQTARILASKNIPVIALAKDKNHHSCKTNVCEEIIITDTESEEFIEKLIEIGPGFSKKAVLFPCQDTDVLLVSRNRDKLTPWYHIALPDEAVVEMLMDKMKFYSFAEENSFPVPRTFIVNQHSDILNIKDSLDFPCLLKPTIRTPEWIANSSIKAFKIESFDELLQVFEKHKNWTDSFVVQQWLEGDDTTLYSCNCYFNNKSQPLATFIARKLRQWPPRTGQSCLGEECRNDEVLNVSLEIFKKVNYFGLGYIEMKYDQRTKKHFVIEPNIGRPTGRSAIAEAGGVELLYMKYADLVNLPLPQTTQKYGNAKWIHILRDLQSAWFYYRAGELTLRAWLKSIRGKKSYAIFSWRDPLPFIFATKSGFFEIIKNNRKDN